MLKSEFKRDMQSNYLVIEGDNGEGYDSYSLKMLLNNKIPGLLKVEIRMIDNQKQLYYDVTSKQPIHLVFERGQLKKEEIAALMLGIINGMEKGREFLLKENDFVLDPKYVYINLSGFLVSLCYVSGYNQPIGKQLGSFIEYLMDKVDYEDKEAVVLTYGLYKISKEENCTFEQLKDMLERKNLVEEIEKEDRKEEFYVEEEIEKAGTKNVKKSEEPKKKESVQSETEVMKYSVKNLILSGLTIGISILIFVVFAKIGLFRYEVSQSLNIKKIVIFLLIIGCMEGYILSKLLHPNKMLAVVKRKMEDIEPTEKTSSDSRWDAEEEKIPFSQPEINSAEQPPVERNASSEWETYLKENDDKTVILWEETKETQYELKALDNGVYKDIILIDFPFFVGKLKTNVDFVIENNLISRFHAKLDKTDDHIYIADLNSTNGTYVNHERLEPNQKRLLQMDDIISFANISYQFVSDYPTMNSHNHSIN